MSESQVDLSKLARDRSPMQAAAKMPRRKSWLLRYVLPLGILMGFMALLFAAAGSQWLSQQSVTVVPVLVKRGEVQQNGLPLFQAAGWIEPRPTAVNVAALAPGVIEELLVVEGQKVAKHQPIARLIAIDAELAVEQAQATLAIREGELQRAEAERDAAIVRFENPVHLKVLSADAKGLLARTMTELDKIPFLIQAAQASADFTRSSLDRKRSAQAAIAGIVVAQAANDHASAHAELAELKVRGPNLKREVDALQEKVDALQQQLELLVDETRQLQEAKAKVISSTAIRDEAQLRLRQAKLNLERTVVRAPMTGRILQLVASPGSRVMGLDENAGRSSSTVVEMYDPEKLQVRADVRLEDVPMVFPGAPVEIETASSAGVIHGRVLQSTSSANIQKNTLEVKVELLETSDAVSPEMLVTATFLAPVRSSQDSAATDLERLFVPEQLVQSDDSGTQVWVVDANHCAARRAIRLGATSQDGLVEVVEGLNVTDKLIASDTQGLQAGDTVVVSGEDQTIGVGR